MLLSAVLCVQKCCTSQTSCLCHGCIQSRDHGLLLQHIPSHAARTLYQRSYQRVKLSLSWFSPAEVCGKASFPPSPSPQSQCWKCPRANPCCVAPCRTTAQPCCCCRCPGEAQLWHAALQILHPLCFLREKITVIAVFLRGMPIQLVIPMRKILRNPCKIRARAWGWADLAQSIQKHNLGTEWALMSLST